MKLAKLIIIFASCIYSGHDVVNPFKAAMILSQIVQPPYDRDLSYLQNIVYSAMPNDDLSLSLSNNEMIDFLHYEEGFPPGRILHCYLVPLITIKALIIDKAALIPNILRDINDCIEYLNSTASTNFGLSSVQYVHALIELITPLIQPDNEDIKHIVYSIRIFTWILGWDTDLKSLYNALMGIALKDPSWIEDDNPFKALCYFLLICGGAISRSNLLDLKALLVISKRKFNDRMPECIDLKPYLSSFGLEYLEFDLFQNPSILEFTIDILVDIQILSLASSYHHADRIAYYFGESIEKIPKNILFKMITFKVFETNPKYYTAHILGMIIAYIKWINNNQTIGFYEPNYYQHNHYPNIIPFLLKLDEYLKKAPITQSFTIKRYNGDNYNRDDEKQHMKNILAKIYKDGVFLDSIITILGLNHDEIKDIGDTIKKYERILKVKSNIGKILANIFEYKYSDSELLKSVCDVKSVYDGAGMYHRPCWRGKWFDCEDLLGGFYFNFPLEVLKKTNLNCLDNISQKVVKFFANINEEEISQLASLFRDCDCTFTECSPVCTKYKKILGIFIYIFEFESSFICSLHSLAKRICTHDESALRMFVCSVASIDGDISLDSIKQCIQTTINSYNEISEYVSKLSIYSLLRSELFKESTCLFERMRGYDKPRTDQFIAAYNFYTQHTDKDFAIFCCSEFLERNVPLDSMLLADANLYKIQNPRSERMYYRSLLEDPKSPSPLATDAVDIIPVDSASVDSEITPHVDSEITPHVDSEITPHVDSEITPSIDSAPLSRVHSNKTSSLSYYWHKSAFHKFCIFCLACVVLYIIYNVFSYFMFLCLN